MRDIRNKTTSRTALLGRDFPGTRFEVLAQIGDPVSMGQPLMRDRRRPEILFTAPAAGAVVEISRGPKRSIVSMQVEVTGEDVATVFDLTSCTDGGAVRELMLRSGLWTALRQRPFGIIPDPADQPSALLITAMDTQPLAPDPSEIIGKQPAEFTAGAKALATMVQAPVHICKSPGADIPIVESETIQIAEFPGPHPAGLPSTHIQRLCPIGFSSNIPWCIGYQDVISLGYLINTGRIAPYRIVSVDGPGVKKPSLLGVTPGGCIDDIVAEVMHEKPAKIISGTPLSGHYALGDEAYLGQNHNQITVFAKAKTAFSRWRARSVFEVVPDKHSSPLIPTTDLDQATPPGVLTVPMMRALLVGDTERARNLGALELVEEDVAMMGFLCPSKTDYRPLLRRVLNQLQKEQSAVTS
ncbi:MAG: hypothetical protein ACR2QW_04660 [bacterium]